MAKIENLITEIADARLRDEIAREVAALKREKKFGLVFEEHIPEQVLLSGLPIKPGIRAAKRNGSLKAAYLVEEVHANGKARVRPEAGNGEIETVKTNDLVAIKRFGEPIYPTLTPVASFTRADGKPYHTIINADNFHALQLFAYCYAGQVDVIYIDPPYNTGARDWKYNNNYVDGTDQWRHSKWLAMMKRRLLLARLLLKENGILIVAIDDCELHHLRCLLDQPSLFGEENFIGCVSIRSKPSGAPSLHGFAGIHEYALFYRRGGTAKIKLQPRSNAQRERFSEQDQIGPFWWENFRKAGAASKREDRPRQFYPIWISTGGKIEVPEGKWDAKLKTWKVPRPRKGTQELFPTKNGEERVWLWSPERARLHVGELKVKMPQAVFDEQEIYHKRRMSRAGIVPKSMWTDTKYSASEYGTNLLRDIFGASAIFSFPKSPYTVTDCIRCATENPDALIVDFFAGSGTTYHAAALLNAEDGGNRRCLLVTNNEVNEKLTRELNEKGLFAGDPDFEKHGICDSVTWPRCKYVTQGHRDDGTPLPGTYIDGGELKDGFKENIEYFRLDFLDPHEVAYGDRFEAMLPILWLMAGATGKRETVRGRGKWFIPKESSYAVLIREEVFAEFKRELAGRPDITLVFLITDSEEAFREMSAALPGPPQTKMLYKSYLDNFKINMETTL